MRCFKNIANLIKAKRLAHPNGYSQSELSNLLGYKNGQFISNVERALCNIPLKMLKKVASILDISSLELKEAILKDQEETLNNFLGINKESSNGVNAKDSAKDTTVTAVKNESKKISEASISLNGNKETIIATNSKNNVAY